MNKIISFLGDRVTYSGISVPEWIVPEGVPSIKYLVAATMSMDKEYAERALMSVLRSMPWLTIYIVDDIKLMKQHNYDKQMQKLWSNS
jgi:hypothetical protein